MHWTVSALTRYIRLLLEQDEALHDIEVEGEVSDFSLPRSGHAYFTLKDAEAQLRCVMWRSDRLYNPYEPQRGDRVVVRGYLSVYEAGGQYQLYCKTIRPLGLGDLHARFEALKTRLQAEGLFDSARKRPLPERIRVIGLVTSPGAAALQDVLNVLRRRNPLVRVVLSPTSVQGDQAPDEIVAALEALNRQTGDARPDVILVVRGGGSLEDLWCFNDERVARAIAASAVPVVSGVGHEVDFTLADFAADLRAPTPSVAAELVTPVTVEHLRADLRQAAGRLEAACLATLHDGRTRLTQTARRLDRLTPLSRLRDERQSLDRLCSRVDLALQNALRLRREQLAGLSKALAAVNPAATLARGYAIVYRSDGQILRRAADAAPGDRIAIQLHRGRLHATVNEDET